MYIHLHKDFGLGSLPYIIDDFPIKKKLHLQFSFHLAPTELSRKNLLKENIDPTKIEVVGNTVIDAFHMALSLLISNKIAPLMKQKANTPMDYKRTNSCISLKSILSLQKQTPQLP